MHKIYFNSTKQYFYNNLYSLNRYNIIRIIMDNMIITNFKLYV